MFVRSLCLAVLVCCAVSCGGTPLASRPVPAIAPAVSERGELIYRGRVFPLHTRADRPTYVYERRVDAREGELVSTHVTRDLAGAVQLAESARHSPDYALSEYTLYTNQLGQSGSIRVAGGKVSFRMTDGTSVRERSEPVSDPVMVGPTLVGHIVRHLDALRRGERLPIRMAVLDRLETLGFELAAVPAERQGQTRVRMSPSSFVIGLVVAPIDFTFDSASHDLVRLEGRVPPRLREGDEWSDFDARVDYDFVAGSYR